MLTISKLIPQGRGLAAVLLKRAATVELDWDVRQKSRFDATDSQGRSLGVFLTRGSSVRGGDVLVAEDGSLVRVKAAPQRVLKVTACATHGSAFDLTRAAYHLGNRHVALQLAPDHLKLEPDHVLADMLRQMHLTVAEVEEPFDPEAGAYTAEGAAGHPHSQRHPHEHSHTHAHGHAGEGHVHGPECGHGHHHHEAGAAPPPPKSRQPLAIPIRAATPAPHVHGPGCGHHHHQDHDHEH